MFDKIEQAGLSELHFKSDPASQLNAIVAIHSTKLGPALGGCRCVPYLSDNDAIDDVIRLAKGMSYKAALANVPQGGGKAVILQPNHIEDRVALYRAFGAFVDTLNGRYITAVDSGTQLSDMDEVRKETTYVSGCSADGLDPSPVTALGVYSGIKAALAHKRGHDNLKDVHITLQGVGNVGLSLAEMLYQEGAKLTVTDINPHPLQLCKKRFNAHVIAPNTIYSIDCDIFSPCGLGGILNAKTIPLLRCDIVAGSANNQLATPDDGQSLHDLGILYAPDYVINAGGLIQVSLGQTRKSQHAIIEQTKAINKTLKEIFIRSSLENTPTNHIADQMAEAILNR